jgi:hypothetical protein
VVHISRHDTSETVRYQAGFPSVLVSIYSIYWKLCLKLCFNRESIDGNTLTHGIISLHETSKSQIIRILLLVLIQTI